MNNDDDIIAPWIEYLKNLRGHIGIKEPSLMERVEEAFTKYIVISAGSDCEKQITDILENLYKEMCGDGCVLFNFAKQKAIDKQYHTLFDWKDTEKGVNTFFSSFGREGYGKYMKEKIGADPLLKESASAFVELGHLRNEMAHTNFVRMKTPDEVHDLYKKALHFLRQFPIEIRKYMEIRQHMEIQKSESSHNQTN